MFCYFVKMFENLQTTMTKMRELSITDLLVIGLFAPIMVIVTKIPVRQGVVAYTTNLRTPSQQNHDDANDEHS